MLEINTLSSPEIVIGDEKVVNFVSRKALALVVYLAVNPGSCSRVELADLLWSDRSQERATGNLRVVLSDVRKKIGDYLSIDRNSVSLLTGREVWVDVHQLLGAIEDKDLDLAVSLYRGDFLESFYLRGASRFENWQVIEREKIRLELVDGLSEAIPLLLKAGKSKEAIKHLVHLTALEPLLESAHRQLMQAYFENGEVSLALRQYEICKHMLHEELSVTPAEETMNLYAYIAGHRSAGVLVSSIPHNLLNFRTPFIGQKRKTRELVEIFSSPEVRHLSLVGQGGYGKTRLAIHLAKKCLDQFPDGVFWVPLQSLERGSELPVAISDAIGFIHQTENSIKSELLDYLRTRQILLVLDNFEHLLAGAKLVSDILRATDKVKIITTSRQKLNLKGETIYLVRGMDYSVGGDLETDKNDVKRFDAIELFIKSALRSSQSFKPNNEDLETIARICQLVDGMPLAIELAAGWISVLPLLDIEAEIREGFDFLERKFQDVEERHRSLQAVAGGSWSMLTEAEKAVFKKLSIFKGPFRRRAAEKIAGARINDLLSLSNKSFLQKDSEGLLRVHEWLRQFGESELRKSRVEFSETLELFSDYYAHYLSENWWEAWSGECRDIRLEWRNISEAILIAASAGNLRLVEISLRPFFFTAIIGDNFNESNAFFLKLVTNFENRELLGNDHLTYALCLAFYTYFLETENKYEQIITIYDRAKNLLRGNEHSIEFAWISVIENIANYSLDWKRMYENAKQALKIFSNLKDDYALTFTYNTLASRSFGEMKNVYCQMALKNARINNGTRDIAWALMEQGRFETDIGDFKKARDSLTKAYSQFASIRSLFGMVDSSRYLGILAHMQGKYMKAREYYQQAFELCDRVGWKSFIAECKELLGAVAFAMKDDNQGRQLYLDSIKSWIKSRGELLPFSVSPPELSLFLEQLGYPDLAFIKLSTAPIVPFGEMWKPQNEQLFEEIKSRYSQEETKKWTEKAQRIKPIELAIAIRDALSEY